MTELAPDMIAFLQEMKDRTAPFSTKGTPALGKPADLTT